MSVILEITEQRRSELINISLGLKIHKPISAAHKPLFVRKNRKYVYTKPLLKSQTPSRVCKECPTLVYGKAQFCVDHRYLYQRPMPDIKHCVQHRTKSKRRDIVKES